MLVDMVVPERSLEQRMVALNEANRIRSHRARLKVGLGAGRVSPREVLADPDCGTMKVIVLLVALPKIGRVKANKILSATRCSPSKTLDGLTDRQRRELLALMGAR